MRRIIIALTIAAMTAISVPAALAAPPSGNPGRPVAPNSIVDTALAANAEGGAFEGQFDTLIALLTQYPNLVSTLSQRGQYTVFAPTDDAFAGVDLSGLSPAQIENVLRYHVAVGNRGSASVLGSTQIRMLNGEFAEVSGATIAGAPIDATDIRASNGVIHVVEAVLVPPSLR
jgi:uncharacterized surface protein with fasciclin (FAS1) repeats